MTVRMFAILGLLTPALLGAQTTGEVQGRVTDAANAQPLANAQVRIEGTVLGALSDATGRYSLPTVPTGRRTVVARRIGYGEERRQVDVTSGAPATVDIAMTVSATTLGEVVVTGVATPTTRRELPNSVETVSGEAVRDAPAVSSIDQALQGKITGALISENSGQPGGGVSVRLRGTNSILGGAEPLYVVDGVIVDNDAEALVSLGANATRGGAALSNRLADLDPADVERIEVLKGAAAAALYGSRANNGVIQIFTRRGRVGEARITASTEVSMGETPEKYALVSIPRTGVADSILLSRPGAPVRTNAPVDRYDIQDQIFRTAYSTTQRLSLAGGANNTTYYLAGSWQDEAGIVRNNDYERLNFRGTVTQQIRPTIDLTVHGNIIRSKADFIIEGEQTTGVLTSVIFTPTSFNPNFDTLTGRYPSNPILGPNPLEVLERYEAPEEIARFVGGADATWTPLPSLTLRYLVGIDDYRREVRFLQPPLVNPAELTGLIQNPVQFSRQFNNDLTANHVWSYSDRLRLNTGAGFRFTSNRSEVLRAAARELPPEQTLVGGATQLASQSESEIRTMGLFVEERVSFSERLFLTGGLNFEASSAFGQDSRWQSFPRLGASWVIGEEPFFQEGAGSLFSSLRLRAAYGQTGGQPPGAYFRFENFDNTSFSGRAGLVESTIRGNPELKPERQQEWEVGADAGWWRERLLLEATYYDKRTTDLVLSVPLPASSGALRQFQNIGVLTNKGVELALSTINLARPNFTWRSRLTYAANRNRIERLSASSDTIVIGYLNAVVEGQPIGVFYGGVYQRDASGNRIHRDTTIGGNLYRNMPRRLRDSVVVGGVVTSRPFANRIIGDPNPDFTMALLNTFELPRGIELSVLLDGRFGNDVANFTRRITEFFGADKNVEREITGDTTAFTFARNPIGRINIYEEYIEDGSFVKLREVALSIPLSASLVNRIGANGATIRLAGRNLHTWTDYTGLDPEVNLFSESTVARGVDFATLPLPRTFSAGLSINF
jgi:TonB-dependent starch-binding outer membrane protein SusC